MWLYSAMVLGRDLYYRLHVVLVSLGPYAARNLAYVITAHFSSPTKLPLGTEYGFPTVRFVSFLNIFPITST